MRRFPRLRAVPMVVALLVGFGAATARGQAAFDNAHTQFIAVWLHPGLGLVEEDAASLLTLPPGWISGDAIAVLTPADGWPPRARNRLVAKLLESGAGVLDISGRGAAHMADDLAAALRVSYAEQGAGLVVVIGRGGAGDAALSAAADATTREGHQYAAAVRLGPGAPGVRFAPAHPWEAWPMRAALLCDLLADVERDAMPAFGEACHQVVTTLR